MADQSSIGDVIERKKSFLHPINSELLYIYHSNAKYKSILDILDIGPLTVNEISNHLSQDSKTSETTYYRRLKELESAGLVMQAGRRIHSRKTSWKILYDRVSYLFIPAGLEKQYWFSSSGIIIVETILSAFSSQLSVAELLPTLQQQMNQIEISQEQSTILHPISYQFPHSDKAKALYHTIKTFNPKNTLYFYLFLRFLLWNVQSDPIIKFILLKLSLKSIKTVTREISFISPEEAPYKDLIDYYPVSVLPISDKNHQKYFEDRNLKAILYLMYRKPAMSLKEIAQQHHEMIKILIEKEEFFLKTKDISTKIKEPKENSQECPVENCCYRLLI